MNCNTPYFNIRRKILFELLDKFPDVPSRTLAKILHRDNPEFFKDIEHARTAIRTYRGTTGRSKRNVVKITKYFKNVTMA